MSAVIRKLSWSRLSDPKVAMTVSGAGLLLGMLLGDIPLAAGERVIGRKTVTG